jgi:hypothetical protein
MCVGICVCGQRGHYIFIRCNKLLSRIELLTDIKPFQSENSIKQDDDFLEAKTNVYN